MPSAHEPVTEQVISIECEREALIGILHEPVSPAELGVVVVVGGPQYRVGSHRQFVLLARTLAAAGFAVLRFDYRGMGDSSGEQRSFEAVSKDIRSAINVLQRHVSAIRGVALWGLCDGASAALLYVDHTGDDRVKALCLLNPWVRSENSLARTHVKHYYLQRVRQQEFWAKLLRGEVGTAAFSGLMRNLWMRRRAASEPDQQRSFQSRMAAAWRAFDGDVMLALSGNDLTAKEFLEYTSRSPEWSGLLSSPSLHHVALVDADHTLSASNARLGLESAVTDWLRKVKTSLEPPLVEDARKVLG